MSDKKKGRPKIGYWRKRALQDEARELNLTEDFINQTLKKYYEKTAQDTKDEIKALYKKYGDRYDLPIEEAKKKIRAADFAAFDFEKLSLQAAGSGDEELHHLLDTLSQKGKITRLELLYLNINTKLSELYSKTEKEIQDHLIDAYADGYYRSIYNVQSFFEFGTDFAKPSAETIYKAVTQSWMKGNYSKRIWGHRERLSESLRSSITDGLMKGHSMDRMSANIEKRFGVALNDATRLVRTESSYIHNKAALSAYKGYAGIERYQFLAALDAMTSKICQERDGKDFETAKAAVGLNYPPMHPNCRSTTAPYFEDDPAGERIARDVDGSTYHVPGDMKYEEWWNSFSEEEQTLMEYNVKLAKNQKQDKAHLKKYRESFNSSVDIKDADGKVQTPAFQAPGNLKEFQELKYKNPDEWDRYKREYRKINLDGKHYEEFKTVIGDEAPKNLQIFRDIKYNDGDKWNELEAYYNYKLVHPNSSKTYFDIDRELKSQGIKKGVALPPVKINAYVLPDPTTNRDSYHIMHRMLQRNIGADDIQGYIDNAKVMFNQWGGKRKAFYSDEGVAVIFKNGNDWIVKTTWGKADNDEDTDNIMKVVKSHDR